MTYFTSFPLKLPESNSISRTPQGQRYAVQFEILLEDDNSLVSLLRLGYFGMESEAWGKGEGWIIWYCPDMECRHSQDALLELGTCNMRFC